MPSFEKIIAECPDNVQAYILQTILANERCRIHRDLEAFKSMALSYGYLGIMKCCDEALDKFNDMCAAFDLPDKEAA